MLDLNALAASMTNTYTAVRSCAVVCISAPFDAVFAAVQVSNEASTLLAEMVDFNAVATGSNLDQLSNNVNSVSAVTGSSCHHLASVVDDSHTDFVRTCSSPPKLPPW
jgi:hypothetical protein